MGAPAPPASHPNPPSNPTAAASNLSPSSPPSARSPRSPTSSSHSPASDASEASSDHSPTASPTRSSASTPSPSPQHHHDSHRSPTTRLPPPPAAPTPPGLFNLGNTCYLNSVVQVLYHIHTFRTSLLSYAPAHHQDPLLDSFACELTCSLRKVFLTLDDAYAAALRERSSSHPGPDSTIPNDPHLTVYSNTANHNDELIRENVDYVEPQNIINLLRDHERCLEFDARGQQDAHEFLRFLLDKVNDCMQMDNEETPDPVPRPETKLDSLNHMPHNSCTYPALPQDLPPLQSTSSSAPTNTGSSSTTPTPTCPSPSSLPYLNGHLQTKQPTDSSDHTTQAPAWEHAAAHQHMTDYDHADRSRETHGATPTTAATSLLSHIASSVRAPNRLGVKDEDEQPSPTAKRRRFDSPSETEAASPCKKLRREGPVSPSDDQQRTSDKNDKSSASSPNRGTPLRNGFARSEKVSSHGTSPALTDERPARRYRRNLVPDLFQGRAVTATRCYECESQSKRPEMFLDVSLPVEHGKSLDWALSTQCVEEQLLGPNKYHCDVCKTYTEAKRWWQVASLPEVLTVHLKLFAYGSRLTGIGGKVSVAMPCPVRTKLAEWCDTDCRERNDEYILTAVIVHEGTGASSGHYYTYICKTEQTQQWYCFDDSLVTAVSEEDLKQRLFTSMKTKRTAYLLFYSNASDLKAHATHRASKSERAAGVL